MSVSAYSCINCGGPVQYHISTGTFKCERCASVFTLDKMNEAFPDVTEENLWNEVIKETGTTKEFKKTDVMQAEDTETVVKAYHCPFCGAELMADSETLAAALCAFCKTPVTISERLLSGESLPSRVIPFTVTREEAFGIYQSKIKHKPLLPTVFKGRITPSDLKAVYIPFRLYDAKCSAIITAKCENITRWSDSDYHYTKTDTYEARRHGAMDFAKVPEDASEKIDDDRMQEIEPFDIEKLTPFSAKYLSGHYAEAPTTKESDLRNSLYRRLKPAAEQTMLSTISGYNRVSLSSSDVSVDEADSEYVLLPAWMFLTTFKGREYVFAINGQTGKFAGKFPVNWKYAGFLMLNLAIITFAVLFIGLEIYLWIS